MECECWFSSSLRQRGRKCSSFVPPSTLSAPSIRADCEMGLNLPQIDRKEQFYQNWGLVFPHQDGPEYNHSNTVLDGELVIDVEGDQVCRCFFAPYHRDDC